MKDVEEKLMRELLDQPSPSGFEVQGQRIWANYMRELGLEVENDAYGNVWARWRCGKENAPVLMIEAHSDEIGVIVQEICSDGFVRVSSIGGIDPTILRGRKFRLMTSKGEIFGVSGNPAIHMRRGHGEDKVPEISEIYLDLGCASEAEVRELGVEIGTPAVYDAETFFLKGNIVGRALDDRICKVILAMAAGQLKPQNVKSGWDVVFVSSVMEEVGCLGAKMIAARLEPEAAICLDVTHATDTPGTNTARFGNVKLGAGPALAHGGFAHPLLIKQIEQAAKANGIAFQIEATGARSGTHMDTVFQTGKGISSALISLPLRYMHSPIETASVADVDALSKMLVSTIFSLNGEEKFSYVI